MLQIFTISQIETQIGDAQQAKPDFYDFVLVATLDVAINRSRLENVSIKSARLMDAVMFRMLWECRELRTPKAIRNLFTKQPYHQSIEHNYPA